MQIATETRRSEMPRGLIDEDAFLWQQDFLQFQVGKLSRDIFPGSLDQ